MIERLSYFAPCPAGVEPLLADELRRLGLKGVRPQRSGVLFSGTVFDGLRAVYWTRLASRILLTLGSVDATSAETLYEAVLGLPWEDHVRPGGTIAVDASGVNDALRNTQFTAVRVKDAIADRFRERFGRRPSVDVRDPDLRINVAVRSTTATISIDLAGEPLHRRGYREPGVQVVAPMKETLAAAVLEEAGWRGIAETGGGLVDPMCGSGTLAIEAALAAADIAPGLLRQYHPVERWLGFDPAAWKRIAEQAERRRREGLARLAPVRALDADPRAVEIARRCVLRAGLDAYVRVERADVGSLGVPDGAVGGLIATNPPWGERLSERSELPALYAALRSRLGSFGGWRLAIASPDPDLARHLGLSPASSRVLGSGKGAATVSVFEVPQTLASGADTATTDTAAGPGGDEKRPALTFVPPAVKGADAFANRLTKMARHYGKWAHRSGITCYRVYDADLPDFALSVDLYQGAGPDEGRRWAHLSEYAAPAHIDPSVAAHRLDGAAVVAAEVLGVESANVFVKRRERQRGTAQYARMSGTHATGIVAENGLLFEVDFAGYLDTGLFLDHRDTRAWLRELAPGTRFLNLYAYTGSASVYAAAGGAQSTTTVDLSATYLAWAQRNLALNGLDVPAHTRVQLDTLAWLSETTRGSERYDLVFCDPPTFSNSKRMEGTFDVQRDHVALLTSVRDVLAPDGRIVFSCNRRGFALDEPGLRAEGLVVADVTARTIPKDFERTPGVHVCWVVERG